MKKFFYLFIFSSIFIIIQSLDLKAYQYNQQAIFIQAFIIAIISSTLLFLVVYKLLEFEELRNSNKAIYITGWEVFTITLFGLFSIILIYLISIDGLHDYSDYIKQWETINKGLDPWVGTSNSYLPIHNIFAPLIKLNNSFPKILFFVLFSISLYLTSVTSIGLKNDLSRSSKLVIFTIFYLSPFCLSITLLYGLNDSVVTGLILLCLYFSISKNIRFNNIFAGIFLSFATLIKIYPLFIAPVFIIKKGTFDKNFLISYLSANISIILTSYFIWGRSIINPIIFAMNRHSKHLSFFNFSRKIIGLNLDKYSIFLMVIVFVISILVIYRFKLDIVPSVIVTLSFVLSFYKVGHQQFFLFLFASTPITLRYIFSKNIHLNKRLLISFLVWISFLNFYQTFYLFSFEMSRGLSHYMRGFSSIAYILSCSFMLIEFIKLLKKSPKVLSTDN